MLFETEITNSSRKGKIFVTMVSTDNHLDIGQMITYIFCLKVTKNIAVLGNFGINNSFFHKYTIKKIIIAYSEYSVHAYILLDS